MTSLNNDIFFLERAIAIAHESALQGGGPFGAIIVENGEIIAEAGNCVRLHNDPTAHAEIEVIRQACEIKQSHSLEHCVLYASCEPCPMCLGAIYWARLSRLVFSATRHHAARAGFDDNLIYSELSKTIAQRSIQSTHTDLSSAHAVFELWIQKDDKERY
ncbi:MAG: nucleoside deaminase [Bacteroidales bacterium]|nr:nucleoside deaminase [Bacteroidales bacterium]